MLRQSLMILIRSKWVFPMPTLLIEPSFVSYLFVSRPLDLISELLFFAVVRRKTIYEYHKVDKKTDDVSSGSAIYFTALPTCVGFNSCETCITNSIQFECVWCPLAERCSDGMDRHRQDWLIKGCDKLYIDSNCSYPPPTPPPSAPSTESPFLPITNSPTKFPSSASTTTKPWDDFDNTASRVQNGKSSIFLIYPISFFN